MLHFSGNNLQYFPWMHKRRVQASDVADLDEVRLVLDIARQRHEYLRVDVLQERPNQITAVFRGADAPNLIENRIP